MFQQNELGPHLTILMMTQGCWVRGIIDQIELDADGRAVIVEHKTRFNPSLPSHAQKRTARLQVC